MLQLKIYDGSNQYWLDLYDEEPIKVTLQFDDFTDQATLSTLSRSFRVPNTRNNAQFFKTMFMVDGLDFDPTRKKQADLLVDGSLFRQGHIRLQKVYINREQDKIEYEILFLGEVRDFASAVGDKSLCDLDLTDLDHDRTHDNVVLSWQAYPEGGLTDGLLNGDVLYPLIDFGNSYDETGSVEQTRIALVDSPNFTQNSNPLLLNRFKPMIRAKKVLDKMFEEAGFTYTSNVFSSDLFRKVYVSAFGNDAEPEIDPSIDLGYSYEIYCEGVVDVDTGGSIRLRLMKNGVVAATTTQSFPGGIGAGPYQIALSGSIGLNPGDTLEVDLDTVGDLNLDSIETPSYWNISTAPGLNNTILVSLASDLTGDQNPIVWTSVIADPGNNYNPTTGLYTARTAVNPAILFDCEYKQIDFLQDILKLGRLVMVPDRLNPRNFTIEPWDNFIGSGEIYDWSDKLDHITDVEIEPLFYTQKADHEFMYAEDKDYLNDYHQRAYKQTYGYIKIESGNELLKDMETTKLKIAATPINHIEGASSTSDFVIPQIHTHDSSDTGIQHLPIKPVTRLLFYNGLQTITNVTNRWYMEGGGGARKPSYPLVSQYSEWPMTINTLHMTWSVDIAYFGSQIPGVNPSLGFGMYNGYWRNYISSVYNSTGRIVRGYFVLNTQDLTNISFDDVVFVDGAWYRINKIQDAPIGQRVPVLVELVKLIDYKPEGIVGDLEPGDFTGELPWDYEEPIDFGGSFGNFGGGTDPSYGEYYLVRNCANPEETKVASHSMFLPIGCAVYLTGSGNVDKCWEVIAAAPQGPATPVTLVFWDCEQCESEMGL